MGSVRSIEAPMIFGGKNKPSEVTPEARERLAEIVERYLAEGLAAGGVKG